MLFPRICNAHMNLSRSALQSWTLSRDILHALLVPIVELFNEAVTAAEQSTSASRTEDLEYAFHGSARFAFVWLQSFLDRERKWCLTHGCPACVVEHALDSEFSIQLLFAASLLSDLDCSSAHTTPSLPSFGFFAESLKAALVDDDLWSGDYIERVMVKARQLKEGIEMLIEQNAALHTLLSMSDSSEDEPDIPAFSKAALAARSDLPRTRVRRGRIAQRQLAVEVEEACWREWNCSMAAFVPVAETRAILTTS